MDQAAPSDETPSRYVIGIDLGTTNSAVAFVDTAEAAWRVRTFSVPQVVAPGQVEARETLPSFHYQPGAGEFAPGALRLPWSAGEPAHTVGFFARDHGAMVPGRLIASAKSWLCHPGVDRTAELLPWQGAPDVERLSPVEVSARYLQHIREAWDAKHKDHPLAVQDVVLTLPASFDEVARELTVQAARRAGLPRIVLIEEPQAAFYAWIDAHRDDWQRLVEPGQKILVCDIGGGTSDFTLIRVRRGEGDRIQFHRVAVGEHLILGGDNLDLALAHHIEGRLTGGGRLEAWQWAILVRVCRQVKETLLGDKPPERLTVTLPGAGSRLIGGGVQVEVTREEAEQVLVDGFLPRVGLDEKPAGRRSGFQEFGLPYAPDAAVTRYLAAFLTAHRHVALAESETPADHDPARPEIVLFNGGLFESPVLRARLLEVLCSWFNSPPTKSPSAKSRGVSPRFDKSRADRGDTPRLSAWTPLVLENKRLDLAVARGAAYYGMVRRGQGVRIAAGLARTYYIGVEGDGAAALCLVPAGVEPGHTVDLIERRFDLRVSQPVEFPLFVSSTRLTDRPGELVPFDREQMTPLPLIRTVLHPRKKGETGTVSVDLHARLTEIGTLDLWCSEVGGKQSWKLQFDVRSTTQTDVAAHAAVAEGEGFLDEAVWQECRSLIHNTFGPEGKDAPEGLVKRLAAATGMSRGDWPTSLLRRFWEALMEVEAGRHRSQTHQSRWFNLLGFSLRPGYGLAADDWRIAETRRVLQRKVVQLSPMVLAEWWILWRRIAGGLTAGQQLAFANTLLPPIRQTHRQLTTGKGRGGDGTSSTHEAAEIWRLLGSLELLPISVKVELGGIALDLLERRKLEPIRPALLWALGRLGARQPVYGPLNTVVPAEVAGKWLRGVIELDDPTARLAVMQLARRTSDRYRDVSEERRETASDWLASRRAPAHFVELVRVGGTLDVEEQGMVFGEALPKGLRIP